VSTRHAKVDPASVAVKANVGVESLVGPFGPEPMVVSGAVVSAGGSIVQVRVAGEASTLPAASVARTLNVCEPALSALYAFGLVHVAKAPASSLHSKVDPDSLDVNANEALVEVVGFAGPEPIVVSGGVVSAGALIVQVRVAGEASVLAAASVARTLKVCEPVARAL
jgi:hypothetical protein